LTDDYTTQFSLKCKKNAGPVAVTIESNRSSSGSITSKVGTKFSYAGLKFDKFQFKPDGSYALETSLSPFNGTLMTFKGGKGSDLGLQYTKGNFLATGTLDVKDMQKISATASLGVASGISIGGDAAYKFKAGFSGFNLGATYSTGPICATVGSNLSQVNAGFLYKVNDYLTLASSSSHSKDNPMDFVTVGGHYKAPFGDVKAKVTSDGNISACIKKNLDSKVTITLSGSAPTSDLSNIKYGLGIVM